LLKKADCGVPSRLAKATLKGLGLALLGAKMVSLIIKGKRENAL